MLVSTTFSGRLGISRHPLKHCHRDLKSHTTGPANTFRDSGSECATLGEDKSAEFDSGCESDTVLSSVVAVLRRYSTIAKRARRRGVVCLHLITQARSIVLSNCHQAPATRLASTSSLQNLIPQMSLRLRMAFVLPGAWRSLNVRYSAAWPSPAACAFPQRLLWPTSVPDTVIRSAVVWNSNRGCRNILLKQNGS